MASRQEMRAFVRGQCHVEYRLKGPEKRLVSPWSRGPEVADILACDDEQKLRDWTHAETGAPALGARPPGFEMGNQGAVRDAARPRR